MGDYISRNQVTESINKVSDAIGFETPAQAIEYAVQIICKTPAADVRPVVRGEWEWREEWEQHPETHSCDLISCGWYCTRCGIELGDYLTKKLGQSVILDDDFRPPKLEFCPSCGADMRGGQNNGC